MPVKKKKATKRKKQLSLETLTIVSADGTPRMRLTTDPMHGLHIELLDEKWGRRFCLGLNPGNTPFLAMHREDGTAAVGMGFGPNGEPGMSAYYPNGLPAVRIYVADSGDIEMELIDRNDKISRFRYDNGPEKAGPVS